MTLWAIRYNLPHGNHIDIRSVRYLRKDSIAYYNKIRTDPAHKYESARRKGSVLAVKVELTEANA